MPPIDPKLTRVRVATTSGGTYANVGYVRSFELTEGEDGGGITRYMGGEIDVGGDPTLEGSMPVLFDRGDTAGQEILRARKRAGQTVFLQFCPEGTAAGAKVEQFEARITEVTYGADIDDDFVSGSFSFRGFPLTLTTVTLI